MMLVGYETFGNILFFLLHIMDFITPVSSHLFHMVVLVVSLKEKWVWLLEGVVILRT